MKKKILIALGIMIFICIIIIAKIIYFECTKYTLEDTKELVRLSLNVPNNIYINTKYFDENGELSGTIKSYYKDGKSYIKQEKNGKLHYEIYSDNENKTLISIMHLDKQIFINENHIFKEITEDDNEFLVYSKNNERYAHLGIYKYLGKEKVNERECIKVSLTDNNKDSLNSDNYYIDIEKGYILKKESFRDEVLSYIIQYEYIENIVDDEILNVNIDEYIDYEVIKQ